MSTFNFSIGLDELDAMMCLLGDAEHDQTKFPCSDELDQRAIKLRARLQAQVAVAMRALETG